jgi:hypothetical protein
MSEFLPYPASANPVAVLFHPSAVPVVDVFRSLNSLSDDYDLAFLDEMEQGLARFVCAETAKGIVSDMLLLAFALTRQRGRAFLHRPLKSRCGSLDEYCLVTLMVSSQGWASSLADEAASALGIASADIVPSLTGELVRQIEAGSLVVARPDLDEFRAVVRNGCFSRKSEDHSVFGSQCHFTF